MSSNQPDRRTLLQGAAAIGLSGLSGCITAQPNAAAAGASPASLTLGAAGSGPSVPLDFLGLSYETQQLADQSFFSPANRDLVAAFRDLSPKGVLRIGGNTSEFSWWKPAASSVIPPRREVADRPGQPRPTPYAITPDAIDQLEGFLSATGWTCVYGLNLGLGLPENLAREAGYVAGRLGDRLDAFTIGNEPQLYTGRLRDAAWNPKAYLTEWLVAARAIQAAIPSAAFILPEASPEWMTSIAALWPTVANPPRVRAMSHHYYAGGPPDAQKTPAWLMRTSFRSAGETARAASRRMGVPCRLTETNTCYRGGMPGVSDAFVSALWSADLILSLMATGYAGVNLHGGAGEAVANSVGGLPGEALLPDAQPRPRPFYTPIATIDGLTRAQPVSYGMRFAGLFKGARMRPVTLQAGGVNAAAYAADVKGGVLVAIVNKDLDRDLRLTLGRRSAVATLVGPGPQSRLAFLDLRPRLAARGELVVPRASAMMVRIKG